MTIYLDAVWALNFFLDMMLLLLTQALSRNNARKRRILLGALIASLLVPITIYFPDSFIASVIGKILYSILIIFSTFGYQSIYRFSRLLLLFYFTTFAIGGGLIGLHFLLQNQIGMSGNRLLTFTSGYGDPVSWLFVVIGFPIIWLFTKSRMDKHVMEKIRYDQLYDVTIQIKNQSFTTTGYIDSGNQLVDPLSKKPVIICDDYFLKQWFTGEEWQLLKMAQDTLDFEVLPNDWQERIQIVPYQGVGGESKFLITIRPEQLIVYYNGQKVVSTKLLIGVQFAELAKDRSYHCLLHPQIIRLATIHSA